MPRSETNNDPLLQKDFRHAHTLHDATNNNANPGQLGAVLAVQHARTGFVKICEEQATVAKSWKCSS